LRPVGDGVKRRAHDADLKRMGVIRSPSPQLVPFKLHRFGKQRRLQVIRSLRDRYLRVIGGGIVAAKRSCKKRPAAVAVFHYFTCAKAMVNSVTPVKQSMYGGG
ncbi:hypothetical protein, partial [Aeromonas jandaei]|uniref:hypothetical protein n=1 Tax=Aeromonas jandaei TaxID=650 RepID=UPI001F3E17C7